MATLIRRHEGDPGSIEATGMFNGMFLSEILSTRSPSERDRVFVENEEIKIKIQKSPRKILCTPDPRIQSKNKIIIQSPPR